MDSQIRSISHLIKEFKIPKKKKRQVMSVFANNRIANLDQNSLNHQSRHREYLQADVDGQCDLVKIQFSLMYYIII